MKETTGCNVHWTNTYIQIKTANYHDLNVQGCCFYYYADRSFPAGPSDDICRAHRWRSRLGIIEHT